MNDPIEVNASPLPDQLWAAVRQIAPAVMAFALGKGWLDNDMAVLLGVVGGVAWPIVAGQLKTRERAKQLAHVAASAPNDVAVVK
jgi:uncharacterized membrane protein